MHPCPANSVTVAEHATDTQPGRTVTPDFAASDIVQQTHFYRGSVYLYMSMQQNVGSTDGTTRVLVGAVAGLLSLATLAGAVSVPAITSPVLGVMSLILIGTSLVGSCPLYTVLGLSTCPVSSR